MEDGYAVDLAGGRAEAVELLGVNRYDLVVLDLGLPDGDGLAVCRDLRAAGDGTRVLVLTARDELTDTVGSLDAGDYLTKYLTKPFAFPELTARLRALLLPQGSATRRPGTKLGEHASGSPSGGQGIQMQGMRLGTSAIGLAIAGLVTGACGDAPPLGPLVADPQPATSPAVDPPPADPRPSADPPADLPPATSPAADRPSADSPDVQDLTAGLNQVGYDLFAVATEGSDADVVLSPFSIGIAFGMADVGASGAPAAALEKLFAYPVAGEARWSAFNTLEQAATDVGGPVVRTANRLYPDTQAQLADGYGAALARWFGAGAEPLPLQADPEGSRQRINAWVAERTEELIPDLLPPGFVNPTSVLVLVNALYLQADWARPFGKYPTEDAPFTRLDGSTAEVPLMHELELSGPAVAGEGYDATEVPYAGGELSMLVIVPAQGRYAEVEGRLRSGLVDEVDAAAAPAAVELWLPRFDSARTLDLREAIERGLGVGDLFGGQGWDGIAAGVTLEQAVHAANISVDEFGTVAAAATALGFAESGPGTPDITVRADRPFLYVIRHLPTGAVLFVGRVLDPAA